MTTDSKTPSSSADSKDQNKDEEVLLKVSPTFDISVDPWLTMSFSDVKILAFGECFWLHKALLCNSPYFNTLFTGEFQESQETAVQLVFDDPNIDSQAFCHMLTFLYGKPTRFQALAAHRVLAAAHFFGVQQLVDICLRIIERNMTHETFRTFYSFSLKEYGEVSSKIRSYVIAFLYREGNTLKLEHWSHLEVDDFLAILGSKDLWVSREWDRVVFLLNYVYGLQASRVSSQNYKDPARNLMESSAGSEQIDVEKSDPNDGVNATSKIGTDSEDGQIGRRCEAIIERALQSGCIDLTSLSVEELSLVDRIWENCGWCKSLTQVYLSGWKTKMWEAVCRGEISREPVVKSEITQQLGAIVLEHPDFAGFLTRSHTLECSPIQLGLRYTCREGSYADATCLHGGFLWNIRFDCYTSKNAQRRLKTTLKRTIDASKCDNPEHVQRSNLAKTDSFCNVSIFDGKRITLVEQVLSKSEGEALHPYHHQFIGHRWIIDKCLEKTFFDTFVRGAAQLYVTITPAV